MSSFDSSIYPELDKIPPVDSPQVKQWLKELEGQNIPNIAVNPNTDCSDPINAAALANAGANGQCWWTCGGCVRETDVEGCPSRDRWGLTFDDGPSPYTPKLLTYLQSIDTLATFYLVGSRVVSRPETVQAQLMLGHELSVHTWSHSRGLTSMTTAQVVAELGWTRQAIKDVTGLTPLTFRAPFGDFDDRIRAIAHAMNLTPVIWTTVNAPNGTALKADTEDFEVPAGQLSAPDSVSQFRNTLAIVEGDDNESSGIITLEHDLFQETVDLAIGETLPNALSRPGPDERGWALGTVAQCRNIRAGDSYAETTTNTTVLALLARLSSAGTPTNVTDGTSTALPTPSPPPPPPAPSDIGSSVSVGPGVSQTTSTQVVSRVETLLPTPGIQPSPPIAGPLLGSPAPLDQSNPAQPRPDRNHDQQSVTSGQPDQQSATSGQPSTSALAVDPVQPTGPPQPLPAVDQPQPQQEIGAPLGAPLNAPGSAASSAGGSNQEDEPTTTTITVTSGGDDGGLSFGLRNFAVSSAPMDYRYVGLVALILVRLV